MKEIGHFINKTTNTLLRIALLLLMYQIFLSAGGYNEDPLLKYAVQSLNLDKCASVRRGKIPEHPVKQLTSYPTVWVWLKENPYFLCRFR